MAVNATIISLIKTNSRESAPNLIVSTNFDSVEANTAIINSISKEVATIANVLTIITVGEVALILQKCYIIAFEQTIIYPRYSVCFSNVMSYYCEYYASYSAIGSIVSG